MHMPPLGFVRSFNSVAVTVHSTDSDSETKSTIAFDSIIHIYRLSGLSLVNFMLAVECAPSSPFPPQKHICQLLSMCCFCCCCCCLLACLFIIGYSIIDATTHTHVVYSFLLSTIAAMKGKFNSSSMMLLMESIRNLFGNRRVSLWRTTTTAAAAIHLFKQKGSLKHRYQSSSPE